MSVRRGRGCDALTWAPVLLAWVLSAGTLAAVSLPSLFSAHAVLQRAAAVPVWGRGAPGEPVTVTLGERQARTVTDADGLWRTELNLADAAEGPHELVVTGTNRVVVPDVIVGEVWLCGGQSNMEWKLAHDEEGPKDAARGADSRLRQFLVKAPGPLRRPGDTLVGRWTVADPTTSGDFSAVAYWFGKSLRANLRRPVGLINASVGGSVIERWMSVRALQQIPDVASKALEQMEAWQRYGTELDVFRQAYAAWASRYSRSDPAPNEPWRKDASFDDGSVSLPGGLRGRELPEAGVFWLVRDVEISAKDAGLGASVELGEIHGFDTVFWNGYRVGGSSLADPGSPSRRSYWVPGEHIVEGRNTIAVRLFIPAGHAGVLGSPGRLHIGPASLAGEWHARLEHRFEPLDAATAASCPEPPEKPSEPPPARLYEGMIEPLAPFALRGAIWYQGESNVAHAKEYREELATMIDDWRERWGVPFAFYVCQLPRYGRPGRTPSESTWAQLREAQLSVLALPSTGVAVTMDTGEADDIHPRRKREVGERLALLARARAYGERVIDSGPMYAGIAVEGRSVRLRFTHTDGGLVAHPLPSSYQPRSGRDAVQPLPRQNPPGELEGFTIRGADGAWSWARAKIDGDTVLVWSPAVPQPVAVRYAWADYPVCNLYNGAGLPAAPFRTDTEK